jgi:hypothetical protein
MWLGAAPRRASTGRKSIADGLTMFDDWERLA